MSNLALITGGQKGIGLGISRALVAAGWEVAIASSSAADTAAVTEALAALGPKARYYQHDLRDIGAIEPLLAQIQNQQGPIHALVSNAGVPARQRGDMLDITPDNFDFTLDINLRGAFFLAQAVARQMCLGGADSYRSIVFVTSVSASMASVERAEYCISKAGAGMMAQLFAARLAGEGIGVFELRPGIIETGMTAGVHEVYTTRIEGGLVPARRWGQPADIADVVLPMVSGQMRFANGAVVPVDGGLSINRL